MSRKILIAAMAAFALVVAGPAHAITYGYRDYNLHPNVGAMAQDTRGTGELRQICSGTLISPTVYLTAAHCTDYLFSLGFSRAFVTFDTDFDPRRSKFYEGAMHQHESYPGNSNDSYDIAVIVFPRAIKGITPARLPELNQFADTLDQDSTFTAVGYGLSEWDAGTGSPTFKDYPYRQYATSTFNALNETWLRLSQNPATGDGGTCYGDSGGPNFLGTTDIIAGTTITGDSMCRATNDTYRMDTTSARAFLDDFVKLP